MTGRELLLCAVIGVLCVAPTIAQQVAVQPGGAEPKAEKTAEEKFADDVYERHQADKAREAKRKAAVKAMEVQPYSDIKEQFDVQRAAETTARQTAGGNVALPKPPPFQLPLFDGKKRDHQPPSMRPEPPEMPDPRLLFDMAVACWPGPSLFRLELTAQAGTKQRQSDQQQNIFNPNTGAFESQASGKGSEHFVGLVASMPLYSAMEIDRERVREAQRRGVIAQAVGNLGEAIGQMEVTLHQVKLYRAVERRSQERVALGVAETAEQLGVIQTLATLEGSLYKYRAQISTARLTIVGLCAEDRSNFVDAYIAKFTAGMGLGDQHQQGAHR
jgi:hypothetical protein